MNIVITGSTKGIGFGMAREFLRRGHNVVISSRGQQAVDAAVAQLSGEFPAEKIAGQPCNVGHYDQVQELWNAGEQAFGSIDIWVNNAGRDGIQELLHEIQPEDYTLTVTTNLTGLLHCNRVAIAGMRTQGNGKIFNMEGFGSDGSTMAKYVVYGATKYAVKYVTKALVKECKDNLRDRRTILSSFSLSFLGPALFIGLMSFVLNTAIGESDVLDPCPFLIAGNVFRPLQHAIDLVEVDIAEQRRDHSTLRNAPASRGFQNHSQQAHDRVIVDAYGDLL